MFDYSFFADQWLLTTHLAGESKKEHKHLLSTKVRNLFHGKAVSLAQ